MFWNRKRESHASGAERSVDLDPDMAGGTVECEILDDGQHRRAVGDGPSLERVPHAQRRIERAELIRPDAA